MAHFPGEEAEEIARKYGEELEELKDNNRNLIMFLTELADDYRNYADIIVAVIENHIKKVTVDAKLPAMYLMDSIMKNHKDEYCDKFQHNIVSTFSGVFAQAPENLRASLYKLRNTWNVIFPPRKLYELDRKVKTLDPAWPITARPPVAAQTPTPAPIVPPVVNQSNIHINPAFFTNRTRSVPSSAGSGPKTPALAISAENESIRERVRRKERELLELKAKKLELELEAERKAIEEQNQKIQVKKEKAKVIVEKKVHLYYLFSILQILKNSHNFFSSTESRPASIQSILFFLLPSQLGKF